TDISVGVPFGPFAASKFALRHFDRRFPASSEPLEPPNESFATFLPQGRRSRHGRAFRTRLRSSTSTGSVLRAEDFPHNANTQHVPLLFSELRHHHSRDRGWGEERNAAGGARRGRSRPSDQPWDALSERRIPAAGHRERSAPSQAASEAAGIGSLGRNLVGSGDRRDRDSHESSA